MENIHKVKPIHSVIMLIYHRTPELVEMARDCIESVKKNSEGAEIIIVDNGSTQRHDWEKQCDTYIRFDRNMGISWGWNAGLKLARGKHKTVIGDDVLVPPGWLEGLRKGFEQPNCGVVNPYVEHLPMGIGLVENYKWPSGACFMLTQETIDKVGYFDYETFFPTDHEDWDYWTRVYQAGLKMYRNYSISVKHREGATTKASDLNDSKQQTKQAFTDKWGSDGVDVFCGDAPIENLLK